MEQQLTCPQYVQYLGYVCAAYSLVWIGLFCYLIGLSRRRRVLEREVGDLRALFDRQQQ